MENTNTMQFKDDQANFYLAEGESYVGPFKASEIYQKLQSKEIAWVDFVYREQESKWVRLSDHPVFTSYQSVAPKPMPKVTPPPPPVVQETKWFLFQNETQTGPYGTSEVLRLAQAGQLAADAYVWQEKFTEWKLLTDIPELKIAGPVQSATPAPVAVAKVKDDRSDRRVAPRRPLVAQIFLTNQKEIITGICRDISVGGMQVLADGNPGDVGAKIQLNVTPPQNSGLKAFVAEGVIVRLLEDGRGFSFRFTNLKDDAKKAIESYIA